MPEAGNQAEAQLGETEARHFIGDDQVAGQRQFEAAAEGDSVDRGDGGERGCVESVHHVMNAFEEIAQGGEAFVFRELLGYAISFAEIGSGAETFFARAVNDQRVSFALQ